MFCLFQLCSRVAVVDAHWSVFGCRVQNVRTGACKLKTVVYTRRPADNHFRCVCVCVSIFSDWPIEGMFLPKRLIAVSCSYKGKFFVVEIV